MQQRGSWYTGTYSATFINKSVQYIHADFSFQCRKQSFHLLRKPLCLGLMQGCSCWEIENITLVAITGTIVVVAYL